MMKATSAETLYLRGRVRASLVMAVAATEPCARIAHETLARLYQEAIATVSARRPILTLRPIILA